MLEISSEWLFQIFRIVVVLSTAVFVAVVLLRLTKASPTTRVLAWLMVLLPGWLMFSFSLEIPWYESSLSQSTESALATASLHNLENELNAKPSKLVIADSGLQSEGNVFLLTLVAIWATGMIAIAWRNVNGFLKLSTAVRMLPTIAESAWLEEFEMVLEASQLRRKPCFKVSNNIGPLVCHSNRSFAVVIPEPFWSECNSEQRIAVLQHELAHIERGDMWTLLLGRILALPQWFNPLVWFALRRLDEAIEMACDDHVLQKSPEKQFVYAGSLLALVEFSQFEAALALSANGPPVSHRIQRILQPQGIEMKFTRMLTLFTLVSFSIIALFRLVPVAKEPPVQEANSVGTPLVERPATMGGELVLPNSPAPEGLEQAMITSRKTYYVGDLIVPITPEKMVDLFEKNEVTITKQDLEGITQKNYLPLIDLIKNTVRPDSWGGNNSVQAFVPNLVLIVSQDEQCHDEIQDLLAKLRELNEVVLRLESHVVVVDKTSGLNTGGSNAAIISKDYERKISAAARASSTLPVTVSFNGQGIPLEPQDLGDYQVEPINLQMVVTADRQAVRVACMPRLSTHAPRAEASQTRQVELQPDTDGADEVPPEPLGILKVENKGYAAFDITRSLVGSNDNKKQKAFLIVRPTISDRSSD